MNRIRVQLLNPTSLPLLHNSRASFPMGITDLRWMTYRIDGWRSIWRSRARRGTAFGKLGGNTTKSIASDCTFHINFSARPLSATIFRLQSRLRAILAGNCATTKQASLCHRSPRLEDLDGGFGNIAFARPSNRRNAPVAFGGMRRSRFAYAQERGGQERRDNRRGQVRKPTLRVGRSRRRFRRGGPGGRRRAGG